MAKMITVRDIFETRRNLVRFENYARRHMDNLPIEQANESIAEARKLLSDNVNNFDETDISTLTADTTEIRESLERNTEHLDYWNDRLESNENNVSRLNDELKELDPDEEDYDEVCEDLKADMEYAEETVDFAKAQEDYYRERVALYEAELND